MIEAKVGDKYTLRFPDGTPQETVDKAVQEFLAEQGTQTREGEQVEVPEAPGGGLGLIHKAWRIPLAAGETALGMASGAAAYPAVLGARIGMTLAKKSPEAGKAFSAKVAQDFGYQPKTEEGKAAMELIGKGMHYFTWPAREFGKGVTWLTGSPVAGDIAEALGEAGEFALLAKATPARGKTRMPDPKVPETFGTGSGGWVETPVTKVKHRDVTVLDRFKASQWVGDKFPSLKQPIQRIIDAENLTNENVRAHIDAVVNIFGKHDATTLMGKPKKIPYLPEMVEGKVPIPPKFEGLVLELREYFKEIRDNQVIPYKLDRIREGLNEGQLRYFDERMRKPASWMDLEKYTDKQIEMGEIAFQEFMDIKENWGVSNYFPRMWNGRYKYISEDGFFVVVGETAKLAKARFKEFLEKTPDARGKRYYFTNDFLDAQSVRKFLNPANASTNKWMQTQLTRKEYFALKNRAEKAAAQAAQDAGAGEGLPVEVDMSGIAKLKAGTKYSPHFMERLTEKRGWEVDNAPRAIIGYTSSVLRKIGLERARREAYATAEKLPAEMPDAKQYIRDLADNVSGRYNMVDKFVDQTVGQWVGAKPFLANRILSKVTTGTAWAALGFAPVKAGINRYGGMLNTLTKVGIKDFYAAKKWQRTAEGKATLDRVSPYLGLQQTKAVGAELPSSGKQLKWYHPMGMYQLAERFNRNESFAAGYQAGLKKFRGDKKLAEQYGIDITGLTQGMYGTGAMPVAIRNPVARTAYQFKQFMNNQLRFARTLTPAQWAFYLPGIFAVAGTRGLMLMLKSVVGLTMVLNGEHMVEGLMHWFDTKSPAMNRGLPGLGGMDVSAPATWQLPTTAADWMGMAGKNLYLSGKTLHNFIMQDGTLTDEQKELLIQSALPVAYNIFKGIEILAEGKTRMGGKLMYESEAPLKEFLIKLSGGRSVEESRQADEIRYMLQQKKEYSQLSEAYADKLLTSKSVDEAEYYFRQLIQVRDIKSREEMQGLIQSLQRKARDYQLTREIRTWLGMPVAIKKQIIRGE